MPQIKKSTPIYFKPSHEAAAALAKLMERYPGMTRTAVIELAITEHLRIINANSDTVQVDFVPGYVAAEYIKQMSDGLLEKGMSAVEFFHHLRKWSLKNDKHLTADELNQAIAIISKEKPQL